MEINCLKLLQRKSAAIVTMNSDYDLLWYENVRFVRVCNDEQLSKE